MKILNENAYTKVDSEQFFSDLNEYKNYTFFIFHTGKGKEPSYCKRKNGVVHVIMRGISIDNGDSELYMKDGNFFIDMTSMHRKTFRYESVDGWYCEISV